jgi:hypothetical protein
MIAEVRLSLWQKAAFGARTPGQLGESAGPGSSFLRQIQRLYPGTALA